MVIVAIVLAYLVAYPAFAITYSELRRYPRHLWSGIGRPYPWRQATVVSYCFLGLPVLVVMAVWRLGRTRARLRSILDERREADELRNQAA
jgi:hypothetical protein